MSKDFVSGVVEMGFQLLFLVPTLHLEFVWITVIWFHAVNRGRQSNDVLGKRTCDQNSSTSTTCPEIINILLQLYDMTEHEHVITNYEISSIFYLLFTLKAISTLVSLAIPLF